MRGPPEGLHFTCGSSFVVLVCRYSYRAFAQGRNGTSVILRFEGKYIVGLSSPPGGLVARVAPALPSQTPFSPGSGPRFKRPPGKCGVGLDGGLFFPRPPRPADKRPVFRLLPPP